MESSDKGQYRLLIVDSDEAAIREIRDALAQQPFQVEVCSDSADALEKVKSKKVHIVLIDADAPSQGGVELLKQIKKYDALSQVIMVSANATMETVLCSLENGANDFMLKPFVSADAVQKTIGYSTEKLERWRATIVTLVS